MNARLSLVTLKSTLDACLQHGHRGLQPWKCVLLLTLVTGVVQVVAGVQITIVILAPSSLLPGMLGAFIQASTQ